MIGVCFGCKKIKKITCFTMKYASVGKNVILCSECSNKLFLDCESLKSDMRKALGKG